MPMSRKTGSELIAEERLRQVQEEGWTSEHDAAHVNCELLDAALCYAGVAGSQMLDSDGGEEAREEMECEWPWSGDWWKPSDDPVRNLTKAGALIAAEIDRIQAEKEKAHA
jgi:hypothetical protein